MNKEYRESSITYFLFCDDVCKLTTNARGACVAVRTQRHSKVSFMHFLLAVFMLNRKYQNDRHVK